MICEKCGGKLSVEDYCALCGHDNSGVDYKASDMNKISMKRSTRVTVFTCLIIILCAVSIFFDVYSLLFNRDFLVQRGPRADKIVLIINILFRTAEITICYFILKMKKWALFTYIVTETVAIILMGISIDFIYIFVVGFIEFLLLYFIFNNEWEYFD